MPPREHLSHGFLGRRPTHSGPQRVGTGVSALGICLPVALSWLVLLWVQMSRGDEGTDRTGLDQAAPYA